MVGLKSITLVPSGNVVVCRSANRPWITGPARLPWN
jgi:hypothetical protein